MSASPATPASAEQRSHCTAPCRKPILPACGLAGSAVEPADRVLSWTPGNPLSPGEEQSGHTADGPAAGRL